jgi:hypothetical protein
MKLYFCAMQKNEFGSSLLSDYQVEINLANPQIITLLPRERKDLL